MSHEDTEYYKKHRPLRWKDVVGQDAAVRVLDGMVKGNRVPSALLFTGPSGCGKTTLARILKVKLDCSDHNFNEYNAAEMRGIDTIRDIKRNMRLMPIGGNKKVYLIDECHGLTKDAQNALLKLLEDTPKHVHFFLATTDPVKLLATIKTRCTEIKCSSIPDAALTERVLAVCKLEKKKFSDEVIEKLVVAAEGSGRKALVLLNQIADLEEEEEQLRAISASLHTEDAFQIARALMDPRANWKTVAATIKKVSPTDSDAEGIRRMILSYANTMLLNGSKMSDKAFIVIDVFRDHFYDSGKAGLTAACYEVVTGNK